MVREDDWDELAGRSRNRKKRKKRRGGPPTVEELDAKHHREEENEFLRNLGGKGSRFEWMKEERYNTMFRDIESKIQGAMGTGGYDWVDRRVFDQVFDRLTLMALYKLMKSGVIETLDFPVARGKEAHVFHGTDINGRSVAVKIFHTSNAVFKNLIQYIEGDPRFTGLRRKHRDLVEVWVRKEYRNLKRLSRWGLNVPQALGIHQNVLVMEYLGTPSSPSPKLREVSVEGVVEVYEALLHFLAVAWQKAEMVHGDFSPYNILWHNDEAWVIDVGQGVVESHPKAQEFLVRDVTRLVEWGQKEGLDVTLAEAMYDVLNMNLDDVEERPVSDED